MALTQITGSGISGVTVGNFITMVDMFRLTANQSGGTNAVITANFERVDDASFSQIGTGMTESSGIFTFPTTGLYYVVYTGFIRANNDPNAMLYAQVSSNSGTAFDDVGLVNAGEGSSADAVTTVSNHFFVNVTNASTFQVRFGTSSMGSGSQVEADTNQNYTSFSFVRMGDSQ